MGLPVPDLRRVRIVVSPTGTLQSLALDTRSCATSTGAVLNEGPRYGLSSVSSAIAEGWGEMMSKRSYGRTLVLDPRRGTVECKACGAPVHPHEHACTYCLTVPEGAV